MLQAPVKPVPGIQLEQQPQAVLFAILLVAEAANDGEPGMGAVAQVVINRLKTPARFGRTIREVILQPWAFSSVMPSRGSYVNPLYGKLLDLYETDARSYAKAEEIVAQAMAGALADTVGPSTHYCTNGAHGTLALWGHDDAEWIAQGHHPRWYSKQCIEAGITKLCAVIGRQTFGVTA